MYPTRHVQYHSVSGYVQIVSDGHYLPAFWAHPELGGPFPGLVLLHDYWGLTAFVRSQVRHLAEMGYYVIAPDLFNRQNAETLEQAQALMKQLGMTALPYVVAALNALKTHNRCNGKMGLVGWGMGGGFGLQTAVVRDDLRALVVFYGLPPESELMPAELRTMECPVLGLFAAKDTETPVARVEQVRQTLDALKRGDEIVVYPDVERGFLDDTRDTFHPVAATDAWNRMQVFLETQLEVSPPPKPDLFNPGRIY